MQTSKSNTVTKFQTTTIQSTKLQKYKIITFQSNKTLKSHKLAK